MEPKSKSSPEVTNQSSRIIFSGSKSSDRYSFLTNNGDHLHETRTDHGKNHDGQWGFNTGEEMIMPANVLVYPRSTAMPATSGMAPISNASLNSKSCIGMPGGGVYEMSGNYSRGIISNSENIDSESVAVDCETRQLGEGCFKTSPHQNVRYSQAELKVLANKLQSEDTFPQSLHTVTALLEKGECDKQNSPLFFAMLNSVHNHVNQLSDKKVKVQEECINAKDKLLQQNESALLHLKKIKSVVEVACLQKNWDHFKKQQRKRIDEWKINVIQVERTYSAEILSDRIEEEMEISEDEAEEKEGSVKASDILEEKRNKLKEELEKLEGISKSLSLQLEAIKNEKFIFESDGVKQMKDKEYSIKCLEHSSRVPPKELSVYCSDNFTKNHSSKSGGIDAYEHNSEVSINPAGNSSSVSSVIGKEPIVLSWLLTFFHAHPLGASIHYIYSFIRELDNSIEQNYVESLLKRFPSVFYEESTGIGASLEKKWRVLLFRIAKV